MQVWVRKSWHCASTIPAVGLTVGNCAAAAAADGRHGGDRDGGGYEGVRIHNAR
jgi:hypothetical protein